MMKGKRFSALKGTTNMNAPDVFPLSTGDMVLGIQRESRVDVLFYNNPRRVRVKVWSKSRPGLFRFTDIVVDCNSKDEMTRKVGIAAGAMAEQLIALYADTLEPSECARQAGKHFRDLCEHLTRPENRQVADLLTAQ